MTKQTDTQYTCTACTYTTGSKFKFLKHSHTDTDELRDPIKQWLHDLDIGNVKLVDLTQAEWDLLRSYITAYTTAKEREARIDEANNLLIGSLDYDDFVARVTKRIKALQKGAI